MRTPEVPQLHEGCRQPQPATPIAGSTNQHRGNGGIMGMIVDHSLTAACGLAKRCEDSVASGFMTQWELGQCLQNLQNGWIIVIR